MHTYNFGARHLRIAPGERRLGTAAADAELQYCVTYAASGVDQRLPEHARHVAPVGQYGAARDCAWMCSSGGMIAQEILLCRGQLQTQSLPGRVAADPYVA